MTKSASSEPIAPAPRSGTEEGVYVDLHGLMTLRNGASDLNLFRHEATRSLLLGNVRSRFRGRGMEFEEARLYQPGDDVRSIDWRVSARTGKVHTKVFAEERERPVHLVVDQRSSMFFGSGNRFKSVLAAELAACIGWAALGASDRIGGQVFGDEREAAVRARRNKQALLHFLTSITEFNQVLPSKPSTGAQNHRTLEFVLEECRRLTRPGTALFILSDFHDFDEACAKLLAGLGRHMEITLYWIRDLLELKLDLHGRLGLSDGRSTRSVVFSPALRTRYAETRAATQAQFEEAARRSRATIVPVSTEDDPLAFLRRLYRS